MSRSVLSYGAMALLLKPIPKDEREDFAEKLYDDEANFNINYEGTIIYTGRDLEDEYPGIIFMNNSRSNDIIEAAAQYHLEIDTSDILNYVCHWHNGSDAPMDMLTAVEFRAKQISS